MSFKTYPHSPQLSKLQAAALILIRLKNFDNLRFNPDDFEYLPKDYVPALYTVFDVCDRFCEKDNERGFLIFLERLESCNYQMNSILMWRFHEGFMRPYITPSELEKCPYKIDIVGLLDSLPTITVNPDVDRYEELEDSKVTFAEKFAKKMLPRLLKLRTAFAE